MAVTASAVAASVAKATAVPVAASAVPLSIVVESMPSGGALQYTQVIGTLVIAGIAAVITLVMQRRQVAIAKGALRTAENKLRLDLFDKRYAMFLAGKALIADEFLMGMDTVDTSKYTRFRDLVNATSGASWLLDDKVEKFLKTVAHEAAERYDSYVERIRQNRATWDDMGWSSSELQAGSTRIAKQQETLVELFRPFMRIRHKAALDE
jgi:hypothetical protein